MATENSKSKYTLIVVDVIIYITVTAIAICFAFNAFDSLEPFHRGFFCDDQSLMYPYHEDTVSSSLVAVLAIIILPILVVVIQILNTLLKTKPCCQYFDKEMASRCYSVIGMYLFGGTLTQLVVEILKLFVGRLRPHFFDGCKPNYASIENCTSQGYITNYVCTTNDADILSDIRKSFPSGHSSAATYMVVYLVIYLDLAVRRRWKYLRLMCPIIQCLLIVSALYISVSRLQDNKHHPSDVAVGCLVGAIGSLLTAFVLTDLPKHCSITEDDKSDIEDSGQSYNVNNEKVLRTISSSSTNDDVIDSHDNKGYYSSTEVINMENVETQEKPDFEMQNNGVSTGERY